MLTFSQCSDCKDTLAVTWVGQQTHPTCKQTAEENAARRFVDALQRGDMAEADRLEKEMEKPSTPSLGPSALWYAKQGWPVFPLRRSVGDCDGDKKCKDMGVCQCGKKPATSSGFKDATTDVDQVRDWWGRVPRYNIGLRTGVKFDVIDLDGPAGIKTFSELSEDKIPEVHGKVSTPRGFHLYVKATGDSNRAGVLTGIDYRGVGGYVVAPPSRIGPNGYSWVSKPSPAILE